MPNDVIDQLRTYLDFAAGESADGVFAVPATTRPRPRWYQRGPVVAALAAILVLAIGIPALLLGTRGEAPPGSQYLDPLDVGVEFVWPDSGFVGSPDDIAAGFATAALGWVDVETVSDPDATPDGPVWTEIHHAGSEDIDVLSIPIGGGRRVLIQIGPGGVTAGTDSEGDGQYVGIPQVPDAASAILHIRFVNPDRVEVVQVDQSGLERSRVEVESASPIGGVVIVYFDADGTAVTAVGGHFGPFEASTPAEKMYLREYGITVTYPSAWYVADQNLTPNLSDPREVFSLGSYPLAPGGPNCAQIPAQALNDMNAVDVFVTVQERWGTDGSGSGVDPRPQQFGPVPGSTENEFYDCLEEAELADIEAIHWLSFSDQDRSFYAVVAIGREATSEDISAIWNVLNELTIEPRS